MKVIQVSTWDVPCGIAGYTQGLRNGLLDNGITCEVLPIEQTKLKYMTQDEIKQYFKSLTKQLIDYDVIHIQHEFSFFTGSYGFNGSITNFHHFLKEIIKLNKKIFVTFHTEPFYTQPLFSYESYSGFIQLFKEQIKKLQWKHYISPLFCSKNKLNAIVHTKKTRRIFLDSGFKKNTVNIIKQGVTILDNVEYLTDLEKVTLKKQMGFPENAIILSMFGFISHYKGYRTALNALKILPDNYYLLIIGSPHPNARESALNEIIIFLNKYKKLSTRVKLTGYLELEDLRVYQKITDFCLAPYEPDTVLSSSAALTWALSSGKPVIASKIAFFEELNEEINCLDLFTPGCAGELAYKIENLTLNNDLNQQLVNNGLIYCETNEWRNIAKNHIEIYNNTK